MRQVLFIGVFLAAFVSCSKDETAATKKPTTLPQPELSACPLVNPQNVTLFDPYRTPCDGSNDGISMSWGSAGLDNCMSVDTAGGYLWWRNVGATNWNGGIVPCDFGPGSHEYHFSIQTPVFAPGACIELLWSSNTTGSAPSGLTSSGYIKTVCF